MATLTKDKSGFYKARVKTAQGKTKTISTKATTKPEAKRVLKQSRLAEIEEAAKAGTLQAAGLTAILAGKRITFEEAIAEQGDFLRLAGRSPNWIHSAQLVLKQFAASKEITGQDLTKKPLNTVTEKMVYDYLNAKDGRKATWRNGQRSALSKFFEFCQAKGWMLTNPAKLVRVRMDQLSHEQKEKKRRQPFTEAEVKALLKATELGTFWHSAVALGRYTGLRLGDIAKLEWGTLAVPGKIIVWTDKKDRRVQLDLHPKLLEAISAIPPVNTTYVFPEQREIMMDVRKRANLSTQFRRLCQSVHDEKLGIRGIVGKTFHDLRSTYICDCESRGIPIEHISRDVGHVSSETTRGYMPNND